MAKTPVVRTTCDRCKQLIEEAETPSAPALEGVPKITLQAVPLGLPETIVFNDLCEGCSVAIKNIIDRIRLAKKKDKIGTEPATEETETETKTETTAGAATPPAPPRDDKKEGPGDTGSPKEAAHRGSKPKSAN